MPDLTQAVLDRVKALLEEFLAPRTRDELEYIACGGSAAVYKAWTNEGIRAFKIYDPKFMAGAHADVERRRLDLQRALIGHKCKTLVDVYAVTEFAETAIVEMEYVGWPRLSDVLTLVPDEKIGLLLRALSEAARYLDSQGIVHRDIKPENIHVAPDFDSLKLLDLGVVRDVSQTGDYDAGTDHGHVRPFIATAQYSSPEYLFRLDAPSPDLWRGLTFYQMGAVLHDLINKRPIFDDEVRAGNRWLVARAVLSTHPNFPDADPTRLSQYKALALRCLTKNASHRLSFVGWDDFNITDDADPIQALRTRLSRQPANAGSLAVEASAARQIYDRDQLRKRLREFLQMEVANLCGNRIPFVLTEDASTSSTYLKFRFNMEQGIELIVVLKLSWTDELTGDSASVDIANGIYQESDPIDALEYRALTSISTDASESTVFNEIFVHIAKLLTKALDVLEAAGARNCLRISIEP